MPRLLWTVLTASVVDGADRAYDATSKTMATVADGGGAVSVTTAKTTVFTDVST